MKQRCIFESEELGSLCDMLKCPETNEAGSQCITRAYCRLVEGYVDLKSRMDMIKKKWEECDAVREKQKENN